MNYGIAFTPLVPSLVLWLGLAAIVVIAALLLLSRSRGAAVRVAALALILLALANPSFTREDREPLSSVATVVIDKSPSQNFGERTRETREAQEALVDSLKKIKGLEVRIVEAGQADGETDGTRLFGALSSGLSDVPIDRVAGAFLITDGRVHDPRERRGAWVSGPGACPDHRSQGRTRSSHRDYCSTPFRHRRTGPDHHLPARRSRRQRRARQGHGAPRRRNDQRAHGAEWSDRQRRHRYQARRAEHRRDRGVPARERVDAGQQPCGGCNRRGARQVAGTPGLRRAAFGGTHLAQPLEIRRQRRSRAFYDSAPPGKAGRHADQRTVADRVSDPRTV